jgi:hypothetical protein
LRREKLPTHHQELYVACWLYPATLSLFLSLLRPILHLLRPEWLVLSLEKLVEQIQGLLKVVTLLENCCWEVVKLVHIWLNLPVQLVQGKDVPARYFLMIQPMSLVVNCLVSVLAVSGLVKSLVLLS